ncbi:MAG TPA: glycosyltransferase family 4 protein [Polyangia bacterium]|nr:glycosyltransferase family 4 protein [Polyangia bacterium]
MKILIVLPYSGKQINGGLAVLNEQLTAALVATNHDVRLLTFKLRDHLDAQQAGHGGAKAKILKLQHKDVLAMGAGNKLLDDNERDNLYKLFNDLEVLEQARAIDAIKEGGWTPDVIIGHSRFSGPAAVLLRDKHFKSARVEYFLHSYPFEGAILTGYGAYEEEIDAQLALKKIKLEAAWMARADVVVAMGPLLTLGALHILEQAGVHAPRVHEAIPGVEGGKPQVRFRSQLDDIRVLMVARFNAPIKGLEDIVMAALELNQLRKDQRPARRVRLIVRGIGERTYASDGRTINHATVNEWVKGALGHDPHAAVTIDVKPLTKEIEKEYQMADAVLAPSYIEHFGLVPFEALGYGLPVLVNEISGSGMFLGDEQRFPSIGPPCVVRDFDPTVKRPLQPKDVLGWVRKSAFDNRPRAWADAILDLAKTLYRRSREATRLSAMLIGDYRMEHFANGVVNAADPHYAGRTKQGARGVVMAA